MSSLDTKVYKCTALGSGLNWNQDANLLPDGTCDVIHSRSDNGVPTTTGVGQAKPLKATGISDHHDYRV